MEQENPVFDSREGCNAIIETAKNELSVGCKTTIIPNSVTSIGYGAFEYCANLENITIPSSVTRIGSYAFSGCTSLNEFSIPSSVTTIDYYAFEGCSNLKEIIIPSYVSVISGAMFKDCTSLKNVVMMAKNIDIMYEAFRGCTAIESIKSFATVPYGFDNYSSSKCPFEYSTFQTATLYVPKGKKEVYRAREGWKDFNIIEEFDIDTSVNGSTIDKSPIDYYNLQGHKVTTPQHGLNIITTSDGNVRKVIVK